MAKGSLLMVAVATSVLWHGSAFAAPDAQAKCMQQRYLAAGKFAACQQKAMAKYYSRGDAVKFAAASRKCTAKYAAAWEKKLVATGAVLCSGPRFVDNLDGTVTDRLTLLVWEKKTDDGGIHDVDNHYSWSSGGSVADGDAFGTFLATLNGDAAFVGQRDWRLPSLLELETIRALSPETPYSCAGSPCIDAIFGPTAAEFYWSASSDPNNAYNAWGIYFYNDTAFSGGKTFSQAVRAVRGGL